MNPNEIVLRAIEFRSPPRVPVNYCNRDFEHSDTVTVGFQPAPEFAEARPGLTEWGYVWWTLDHTMGRPRDLPLADASRIATYRAPDPLAAGRTAHLPGFVAENRARFLKAVVGITGFNQATFLRGFDAFLEDLYAEPERAERVLDFVFGFENGIIDQYCAHPVDAVVFYDDWGTQRRLMISPALWREVFRPRYAEQFARIHAAGKKVWFHSCGDVHPIIGDLIDIGVDVLELLQPDVLGVERLADEFGGKVCFCCSVDHQRLAVSGTRDAIFAYARRLAEQLGRFDGGFIAYIEDYASLCMSERNYQWIREAFHSLGADG